RRARQGHGAGPADLLLREREAQDRLVDAVGHPRRVGRDRERAGRRADRRFGGDLAGDRVHPHQAAAPVIVTVVQTAPPASWSAVARPGSGPAGVTWAVSGSTRHRRTPAASQTPSGPTASR